MSASAVETVQPPGVATELPSFESSMPWPDAPSLDQMREMFPVTPSTAKTSTKRTMVIDKAMGFLGVPYVWGGSSPGGFDCSGLIQYVAGQFGIDLPRVSFQQAGAGARVPLSALRPGDLVAWDNSARNNGADHIAFYAGNGWIIEAPRPGLSVRRRRLLPDENAVGVSLAAFYGER